MLMVRLLKQRLLPALMMEVCYVCVVFGQLRGIYFHTAVQFHRPVFIRILKCFTSFNLAMSGTLCHRPACIDHYARTVSEWSKDNTVSFGLRDMIRRFRDCLGH